MSILFIIKSYNDIDHLTPIIYGLLKLDQEPHIMFCSTVDYSSDYRICYLQDNGLTNIHKLKRDECTVLKNKKNILTRLIAKVTKYDTIIGKIRRRYFLNCTHEVGFLKAHNIHSVVFEWSTPSSNGFGVERLFRAAKTIGCTTYSLPHGCNIYDHPDVNSGYVSASLRGIYLDEPDQRNMFDYYVFQGKTRRDICVKLGYDPIRTQAWGSVRFCPEWQKINLEICPSVNMMNVKVGVFKVVFMDHQYDYNVNIQSIWESLISISKIDNVHLVIKQSTREGKSEHILDYKDQLEELCNVDFVGSEVHSPRLIEWCDCVINYGSSIGIEAILQDKPLIVPTFMHNNSTLFESYFSCHIANDIKEMLDILQGLISGQLHNNFNPGKSEIINEIVYGGMGKHDVIDEYCTRLLSRKLLY